jgi:hypothetical protein
MATNRGAPGQFQPEMMARFPFPAVSPSQGAQGVISKQLSHDSAQPMMMSREGLMPPPPQQRIPYPAPPKPQSSAWPQQGAPMSNGQMDFRQMPMPASNSRPIGFGRTPVGTPVAQQQIFRQPMRLNVPVPS